MDPLVGKRCGPRASVEASLTLRSSSFVCYGNPGGRIFVVDVFMPLPETSAVKHNSSSGRSPASIAVHDVDCEGFAMSASHKASGEEQSLQFADGHDGGNKLWFRMWFRCSICLCLYQAMLASLSSPCTWSEPAHSCRFLYLPQRRSSRASRCQRSHPTALGTSYSLILIAVDVILCCLSQHSPDMIVLKKESPTPPRWQGP